jgi:hypothetical protein
MPDLIELVQLRLNLLTLLDQLDMHPLDNNISLITHIPYNSHSGINEKVIAYQELAETGANIIDSLKKELIDLIEHDIDTIADQTVLTQEIQDIFKYNNNKVTAVSSSNPKFPSNRMPISDELKNIIKAKTAAYSSHVYPGLILGCRFQSWIDIMVASDPLYITNYNIKDLLSLLTTYPSIYQTRVRKYEIKNQDYSILPQGQFSIVFSWEYLPWINQEEFEKILLEVYNLLRPGGAFIFNYNNCDLMSSASKAKDTFLSWSSAHRIKKLCSQIGYEIVEFTDYLFDSPIAPVVSWAELRKPGELHTIKLQQSLGAVLSK